MSKPTILERDDGPLVVKDVSSLKLQGDNQSGAQIETKEVMALCRCGASKTKPFCDGSHREIEFKSRGGKPAGLDRLLTYKGAQVSVSFNPLLCGHAAECGRLASKVFNTAQKPWIQPDNGTRAEVEAVVRACPSGALALVDEGAPQHLVPDDRAQIEIEKNGPYWVSGIDLPTDPQGEGMTDKKYVLCRCGKSGNKPYCDGAHRDAKWDDSEA